MPDNTIPNPPAGAASRNPEIDVQHGVVGTGSGYSGQEYDSNDHAGIRAMNASTTDGETIPLAVDGDGPIPPDNGKRASFDYNTGAVHGSGSGAGGGNEGEDFESTGTGGDGFPVDQAITGDRQDDRSTS